MAQSPTNFTATFPFRGGTTPVEGTQSEYTGVGAVGTLGGSLVTLALTPQAVPVQATGVGLTIAPNRLDRITLVFQNIQGTVTVAGTTITGQVSGATGAYAGAASPAGAMSLSLRRGGPSPQGYDRNILTLTGSMSLNGQSVNLAFTDVFVVHSNRTLTLYDTASAPCSAPPLGNGTGTGRITPYPLRWDDNVQRFELDLTCAFSANESIRAFMSVPIAGYPNVTAGPVSIGGGTGRFAGAFGSAQASISIPNETDLTVTLTGTITQAGPTTPVITSVNTAYLDPAKGIAPNTWIEIKGTNLVPTSTPAGGTFWSNAPEFAQGRMPTELGGVSVTINGRPAYVWWFCSRTTTPACATDQINVLTPLDDYQGQVPVVVKNGTASSGAYFTTKMSVNPSILLFSARGDAVATHADGSLVGPASLFPGASTPARPGETISLWSVGFGLPTTPLVEGSSSQSGSLTGALACYLDGVSVPAAAALVSPGLYQINVTILNGATAGIKHFFCTFPLPSTLGVPNPAFAADTSTREVLIAVQ